MNNPVTEVVNLLKTQRIVKLTGMAGTGKTTIIASLMQQLNGRAYVCAYTNSAAGVLRVKNIAGAKTIHSTFYRGIKTGKQVEERKLAVNSITGQPILKSDGTCDYTSVMVDEYVYDFDHTKPLQELQCVPQDAVCIIDESTLPPSAIWEEVINKTVCKIVLIGDVNQLPPVEVDEGAKVFSFLNYFHKLPADVTLNTIYRQQAGSGILKAAKQIMQYSGLTYPSSYDNYHLIERTVPFAKRTNNDTVDMILMSLAGFQIVAWRNIEVKEINTLIRAHKFGFQNQKSSNYLPRLGEIMMLTGKHTTDCGGTLYKGDKVEVLSIHSYSKDGIVLATLKDISTSAVYDNVRIDIRALLPDTMVRALKLKKPNLTTCKLTYIYAITCHTAQGGQWDNVLVVDSGVSIDRQKWRYTAVTRASEVCIVMHYRG